MARKSTLIDTVNQYMNYDNQGAYKQRQLRRFVLTKIINALYALREVPPTWYALNTHHVEQLVSFWKKSGLKNATIMNYLIHLRFFLNKINHQIDGISNTELKLVKLRAILKPVIDRDEILSQLQDPIAYALFGLQSYFGLTLSEAMYIVPTIHVDDKELWITREISTNSKDRIILMQNARQQELMSAVKRLIPSEKSLISQFGESDVRLAYRYALRKLRLPTKIQYRYLYAKARLIELAHLPKKVRITAIKQEMSINAESTVWSYCHE